MIQNLNPSLLDLLPELTGGLGNNSIRQDPFRLETVWLRPVQASTGVRSTYVVPGDWPEKPDHWFAEDALTYPLRKQNNVEYLIDGKPTFEAMVEAIETATGPDHFIILIGWACHIDFVLAETADRSRGARRNLKDILQERMNLGVLARVLLYYNWAADTDTLLKSAEMTTKSELDMLQRIKPRAPALAKIRCIIDDCVKTEGPIAKSSHHHKILIVYGEEGLIGFFGGVDVNEDRVTATTVKGHDVHGPLHDVHARVTGEAAEDLLVLATNRWNFAVPYYAVAEAEDDLKGGYNPVHYARGKDMEDMNIFLDRARAKRIAPPGPHHFVKLGHTVGNPDLAKLQDNTAWPMVRHGIQQAKRFIYIEDQYLWSVDAAEELGGAIARLSHITILFTPDDQMPNADLRYRALKRLKEVAGADASKIRMYVVREPVHQYIHAKMFIFDDEYLLVGSANCNNRGYFTDSEVNGGIADPEWGSATGPRGGRWWTLELNLAHKLRMELWAEHLRMPSDSLVDGVGAEVHWQQPSTNARIEPYKISLSQGGTTVPYLWHDYPYGSYDGVGDDIAFALSDPKF